MGKLFIGTSGFSYWHWKGRFYPEELKQNQWLTYYSNTFNTVELNVTFYRTVRPSTFAKWSAMVPEDFVFVVKGPRVITHINRLKTDQEALRKFRSSNVGLGEKVRCILWQLPPSFKKDSHVLENFLKSIHEDEVLSKLSHAFEFRHSSWFDENVYSLLSESDAALVVSHSQRCPCEVRRTTSFMYFRFHGGERLYSSNYSNDELEEWAKIIRPEISKGDVYVFFNNDINAYAVYNALTLRSFILSQDSV